MAVIGYTPQPTGGFLFHRDDGSPMMFTGPEANGLAQWLDATKGPDARFAYDPSAPYGTTASVPDAPPGPAMSVPDTGPNMSIAPPAQRRTTVPNAGIEMRGGPARPAPAQPQALPQQPGSVLESPASSGPVITGPEAAAYALSPVHVPGRAAYNPEADAASRRPVPVQQTVTGGLPETAEERKAREEDAKAYRDMNRAAVEQVDAAATERIAAAEDQRRTALQNAIQADIDQREALQKRAAVENTWNTTNARLQRERDAVAQQRVDPQRLFKEKGAVASIGSALAVGLGAFGSSLSHTPNYAQQIIDASIQRDIDAQTDAIHRKGEAAQNAIVDFQRTYGLDLQEARMAVKATQLRYAASLADVNSARLASADAKQNAAVIKADLLGRAMKEEAQLAELYKGRQTTQFAMAAPQAATRGYDRNPTAAEIKGRAEAMGAVNKAGVEGQPNGRLQLRMDEDERSRRVALPDGTDRWATSKERADLAQAKIDGGSELKKNIARQREILSKSGSSLDPELRAEYNALAQRNLTITKEVEGFRTLTDSDQEMMKPLTGEGGEGFFTLKNKTLKSLQAAEQHVDFRMREGWQNLYQDPDARRHAKNTEGGLGIKETPRTVVPRKRAAGADEPGDEGGED